MNNNASIPLKERNPLTHQRHRREVLWQITIPVGVFALILLALAVLAIVQASPDQASVWADISLMGMIIPTFIITLIFFIFLSACVYLVLRIIGILPYYFLRAHEWLLLVGSRMVEIQDKLIEPFLRVQSTLASLQELDRQIRKK
jgi:lipopolysaccharide export LptBFGC system permease protein LptF